MKLVNEFWNTDLDVLMKQTLPRDECSLMVRHYSGDVRRLKNAEFDYKTRKVCWEQLERWAERIINGEKKNK